MSVGEGFAASLSAKGLNTLPATGRKGCGCVRVGRVWEAVGVVGAACDTAVALGCGLTAGCNVVDTEAPCATCGGTPCVGTARVLGEGAGRRVFRADLGFGAVLMEFLALGFALILADPFGTGFFPERRLVPVLKGAHFARESSCRACALGT